MPLWQRLGPHRHFAPPCPHALQPAALQQHLHRRSPHCSLQVLLQLTIELVYPDAVRDLLEDALPVANNSDAATGTDSVRVHGIKNLSQFTGEADTADLDDQLIVLYAAAEILARQKQADAQNKIAQAQAHYARLKARMAKTETFVIGGGEPDGMYRPKWSRSQVRRSWRPATPSRPQSS